MSDIAADVAAASFTFTAAVIFLVVLVAAIITLWPERKV